MAELLLELLSEEIPARMQDRAAADLKRLVCERLTKAGLSFDAAEAYVTPRRLALVVEGLPQRQPDTTVERKGPRADAPDRAIEGFLKSVGLTRDRVEERETPKGAVLFAVIEKAGADTADVLRDILGSTLNRFPWPKSMKWGEYDLLWVRPLHNVLAIFDDKEISFIIGLKSKNGNRVWGEREDNLYEFEFPLTANNKTTGHRFMAPDEIPVSGFADYRDKLRTAYVMLDSAERREVIGKDAQLAAEMEGLTLKPDPGLIAEVAGLVEWPVVLTGAIDAEFMDLPAEVLTTSMRHHLKHFALLDGDGNLAPRFLVVANIHAGDGGKQIVAGNERVLRARLADAKFFWDQDRKRTLESRIPDLDHMVFHARLGNIYLKSVRIERLAVEIAKSIPSADDTLVREAARLCKTDLVSGMVGEFPELQGVMGGYYALAEGKDEAVATAIAQHYAPQGPNDDCPTAPTSIAVALADKIDSLVGFWIINEKPTGSKDPFAQRRAALGVIRLIVENKIRLNLTSCLGTAVKEHFSTQWPNTEFIRLLLRRHHGVNEITPYFAFGGRTHKIDDELLQKECERLIPDLLGFFADRLKVHLRERGVRHDLIAAVFALGDEDDLVRLLARVEALGTFLASEDGEHLLVAYRRAANIVRIEEKKDGASYDGVEVDKERLIEDDERVLAERLIEVWKLSSGALQHEKFETAMSALAQLRNPTDGFFDNVTVNCEDEDLRLNRLYLLSTIRNTMDRVADFSKIEAKKDE